jgi:hypothetical protein
MAPGTLLAALSVFSDAGLKHINVLIQEMLLK